MNSLQSFESKKNESANKLLGSRDASKGDAFREKTYWRLCRFPGGEACLTGPTFHHFFARLSLAKIPKQELDGKLEAYRTEVGKLRNRKVNQLSNVFGLLRG